MDVYESWVVLGRGKSSLHFVIKESTGVVQSQKVSGFATTSSVVASSSLQDTMKMEVRRVIVKRTFFMVKLFYKIQGLCGGNYFPVEITYYKSIN